MTKKTSPKNVNSDIDILEKYLKDTDILLDVLCNNFNVSYDEFTPICTLAHELKNRLSRVRYALS